MKKRLFSWNQYYKETDEPNIPGHDRYQKDFKEIQNGCVSNPSVNALYIVECSFIRCSTTSENGGAIRYWTEGQMLVEYCLFLECVSGKSAGGIHATGCSCIVSSTCDKNCRSTAGCNGQFLLTELTTNAFNYIFQSSIVDTMGEKYSGAPINLDKGNQICTSVNISNNHVQYYCAFKFYFGTSYPITTYSSFNSNEATQDICMYTDKMKIFHCNIINNIEGSTSSGIIHCDQKAEVMNCCILGNSGQGDWKLFYCYSDLIQIVQCTLPSEDQIKARGTIIIEACFGTPILHYLAFTEDGKNCFSGIESVGDLTPLIPYKAHQCSNKLHPLFRRSSGFIFTIVFLR